MTCLVDYSDLDFQPCSDDQYRANLYYQIKDPTLPCDLSISELEHILDLRNRPFIPKLNKGEMDIQTLLNLPDDIQWLIWKIYFSKNVLKELQVEYDFVWRNPSDNLIDLCKDVGCIQQGHHELEEMIEDHNMWAYDHCCEIKCDNCIIYGFPCANLAHYGFENMRLDGLWQPNFT